MGTTSSNKPVINLSLFLKLSLVLAMVFFLIVGVSTSILESGMRTLFGPVLEKHDLFVRILRLLQWMGFGGAVIMLLTLIFIYLRGINQYQRLYERVARIVSNDSSYTNPWLVEFPKQDVFGTLGSVVNQFIIQIGKFDKLKTHAIKRVQKRFEDVADLCPRPILLVHFRQAFPHPAMVISFANKLFLEIFAKKGEKDYYDVHGMSVSVKEESASSTEDMSKSSMTEIFETIYEAEIADTAFLDKEIIYAINKAVSSLSPVYIPRKEVTPLHEHGSRPEPIVCLNIEIRPFFDSITDKSNVEKREAKEVLIIFHEVKIPFNVIEFLTNLISSQFEKKGDEGLEK